MTRKSDADDNLRQALNDWLTVDERGGGAGELPADFVAVVQFRSYGGDGTAYDRYEPIAPQGIAPHSAKGLLAEGLDILEDPDDDDDGDD